MKGLGENVAAPPPYYLFEEPFHLRRRFRTARRLRSLAFASVLLLGFIGLSNYRAIVETATGTSPIRSTEEERFHQGLELCYAVDAPKSNDVPSADRTNPRWEPKAGQSKRIVLRNATLFDGDSILAETVDIVFEKGLIRSVSASKEQNDAYLSDEAEVVHLHGKFVTPGLVDIHSHHLESSFPGLTATGDINEGGLGPITPFVRAIDGFKPYDPAIKIIASGGVTSSLNLPGSGNIIGGEAYLVKNFPTSGPDAEPVVEDLLFDRGLAPESRQRYLKLACGENPKRKYGHSRLGLAWLLREHLNKAKDLVDRQNVWCRDALDIAGSRWPGKGERLARFLTAAGTRPEDFELQTTAALIRGEINANVHCYEPEDFESILSVLHEFGVHPRAFHHALEAWQVPEFLKKSEE